MPLINVILLDGVFFAAGSMKIILSSVLTLNHHFFAENNAGHFS